jgi:hypothetical protein
VDGQRIKRIKRMGFYNEQGYNQERVTSDISVGRKKQTPDTMVGRYVGKGQALSIL